MNDLIGHIQYRKIGQIHNLINNDIWKKMSANEHMENCTIKVSVSSKMVSSLEEEKFKMEDQLAKYINNVTPQSKN